MRIYPYDEFVRAEENKLESKMRVPYFLIFVAKGEKPNPECSTPDYGADCHHNCDNLYSGKVLHSLDMIFKSLSGINKKNVSKIAITISCAPPTVSIKTLNAQLFALAMKSAQMDALVIIS